MAIVEDLDVFEERSAQLDGVAPASAVDELRLERREERLRNGIVPSVALAAHADGDAEAVEHATIFGAGVLAAAV